MIFTQTGRVEDYLRYREVKAATLPQDKEKTNGTDSNGPDRSGIQCR